jgi:hypothetical protein
VLRISIVEEEQWSSSSPSKGVLSMYEHMSSSCTQRICNKNSITQFRRGGALVYKWVLLPMFVHVILGLAFALCKWIWYWLLCSIRLALNNTKTNAKTSLRFFLVVFGGMVIKHKNLVGHSKKHLCLWALCFLKCVGVSCDALCQLLHWVTPQGHLLPGLPCSDHLGQAGTYFQNSLLLRHYATSNSYKQSMHTNEPNTYFNNYSKQQWSWVSNKDLEISIHDYYRRKCQHQCWVGIWFVNKHQFTFISSVIFLYSLKKNAPVAD